MLGRPNDFVIVEQGAHHGEFASDVLERCANRIPNSSPPCAIGSWNRLRSCGNVSRACSGRSGSERNGWNRSKRWSRFAVSTFPTSWSTQCRCICIVATGEETALARATGRANLLAVLLLSIVQLPIRACGRDWRRSRRRRRRVTRRRSTWRRSTGSRCSPASCDEASVLIADYGLSRPEFYAPSRRTGTLRSYANHRVLPSLLENIGQCDLTTHVEWTSLAEYAEQCGLTIGGFHRSASFPDRAAFESSRPCGCGCEKKSRLTDLDSSRISGDEIPVSRTDQRLSREQFVRRIQVRVRRACRAGAGLMSEGPLCPNQWAHRNPIRAQRPLPHFLPVADVDGVFLDRERGFLDRFAQGRMRMHSAAEVFAAAAEFHHRDNLGDQLRGGMRKNRCTENAIGLGIGNELDHALDIRVGQGAAVGAEGEFADRTLRPLSFA